MITGRDALSEFHDLVEGTSTGGARLPAYADLLDVVGALRAVPAPVPDPAFVAALRERLLAEAESVLVAAAAERDDTDARLRLRPTAARTRRRNRRLAAVVSGVALVGASGDRWRWPPRAPCRATGSTRSSAASRAPTPSSPSTAAARGRVLLDNAGDPPRRGRASSAASRRRRRPRSAETLDAFTQQAIDGSDLLVADYQATGDRSSITTRAHLHRRPAWRGCACSRARSRRQSVDQLLQAAQALDQVQQASVHACPTCAGPVGHLGAQRARPGDRRRRPTPGWSRPRRRRHHGPLRPGLRRRRRRCPTSAATCRRPASPTRHADRRPDPPASRPPHDVQHTVQHLTDGLTHGPADRPGLDGHRHRGQPARRRRRRRQHRSAGTSATPSTAWAARCRRTCRRCVP